MTNQERYEEDLKIIPEGGSKAYVLLATILGSIVFI